MTSFIQHWVTKVTAQRHDYKGAPLTLKLQAEYDQLSNEVVLYLKNDELTTALVEAINSTVAAHEPAPAEIEDAAA